MSRIKHLFKTLSPPLVLRPISTYSIFSHSQRDNIFGCWSHLNLSCKLLLRSNYSQSEVGARRPKLPKLRSALVRLCRCFLWEVTYKVSPPPRNRCTMWRAFRVLFLNTLFVYERFSNKGILNFNRIHKVLSLTLIRFHLNAYILH